MFTGIIESIALVENIKKENGNIHFSLSCPFTNELKIDQSLSHDGCCLTVTNIKNNLYTVTAIQETLEKTNMNRWKTGTLVNIERSVKVNERLDGHIVQGHVDQTGKVINIEKSDGSHLITIAYEESTNYTTVPQGSIAVNGISLTVAKSEKGLFSTAIIPYTWEHSNLKHLEKEDKVNLEFDIIGKYIARLMNK